KVAPPFRIAEFDVIFGKGISTLGCIVDLAEETSVINRKGAWYSYNGDNISQGRDNAIKYFEEKPEMLEEIRQKVLEKLELGAVVSANSVGQPSDEDEEDDEEEELEEE
ncbi:MAG: DNA recombination/repair protein RecA, partial [Rivularia sp. (in: cyanobacteria)]